MHASLCQIPLRGVLDIHIVHLTLDALFLGQLLQHRGHRSLALATDSFACSVSFTSLICRRPWRSASSSAIALALLAGVSWPMSGGLGVSPHKTRPRRPARSPSLAPSYMRTCLTGLSRSPSRTRIDRTEHKSSTVESNHLERLPEPLAHPTQPSTVHSISISLPCTRLSAARSLFSA